MCLSYIQKDRPAVIVLLFYNLDLAVGDIIGQKARFKHDQLAPFAFNKIGNFLPQTHISCAVNNV